MKIIAGLKTIPGRERSCADAVRSLAPQVSEIYVIEREINGDADKFIPFFSSLTKETDPFIYLACDDDLIYPPDYARFMELGTNVYGGIVSLHGRKFQRNPIQSYYKEGLKYHCLHEVAGVHKVDVGGSGVMAFLSTTCKDLTPDDFPTNYPLMADIHMAMYARKHSINIYVLPHNKGFIQYHPAMNGVKTIHDKFVKRDQLQTARANEMLNVPVTGL